MSLITNTWQQLIRRKLWPVALLLIAALVAVPLKLSKKPEPAPAVPAAAIAAASEQEALAKPIVSLTDDADAVKHRRRVLGQTKDPFEPAPLPKAKKKKKAAKATKADATPTPDATAGGGSSAPPSSAPSSPTPAPTPTMTISKGSVVVRFGTLDNDDLPTSLLGRLDPLPSDDNPVLVFEGLQGRTAVFSVPGVVAGQGDGTCDPDPGNCSKIKLRAGDTEFITVTNPDDNTNVQYELDLVKVYTHKTEVAADPATATAP
jgi:hypothetical protein